MKFVIIGRDGSGKTKLADLLKKSGLSVLKTHTTRPKRWPEENTYHFHTREEAAEIKNKCLSMEYGGYEYFTTDRDIMDADVIVLDPTGLMDLAELYPNESLHVIYITADETARAKRAENRGENKEQEKNLLDKRKEDPRFDVFEERLKFPVALSSNTTCVHEITNDFDPKKLKDTANALLASRQMFLNTRQILSRCIKLGLVETTASKVIMTQPDGNKIQCSLEIATDLAMATKETLTTLVTSWLCHETEFAKPY